MKSLRLASLFVAAALVSAVRPSLAQDEGKTKASELAKDDIYAFIFGQKGLMAGLGLQGNKIAKITPK